MIPVCEPLLTGKEIEYVTDCLKTNWISSKGKYIEKFENGFAEYCGAKHGISASNGTTALHLALASLGIGKGDEVIIPTFTMIATAFSVAYCDATPVVVDSEPGTWNMDVGQIEGRITDRTKAIMPVHIYGHPCDMDRINEIAKKHNLLVVEDAAEAHGGEYKGRKAGNLSDVGCFSFYANKIITTGEGGMVVTNDDAIAERARSLKDLSHMKNKRFLHDMVGYNYRMTNIQAAIGLAQLEKLDEFAEMRRKNARLYNELLSDVRGITTPVEKDYAKNVYWMYSITVGKEFGMTRDELMKKLAEKGIETRAFFIPVHRQPAFLEMGLFKGESYPVSEEISGTGLYLPSSSGLKEDEINTVCNAIKDIQK